MPDGAMYLVANLFSIIKSPLRDFGRLRDGSVELELNLSPSIITCWCYSPFGVISSSLRVGSRMSRSVVSLVK